MPLSEKNRSSTQLATIVKPNKKPPRLAVVSRIESPHPELMRVIFSGENLYGFPENMNGSHIKLFFPQPHQSLPMLPTVGDKGLIWPKPGDRPVTRTYSVRYYDSSTNELAVDFAVHPHKGIAQQWVKQAKAGQKIGIAGPGGPFPLLNPTERQIYVGDVSALPAISAITEINTSLPRYIFLVAEYTVKIQHNHSNVRLFQPSQYSSLDELYNNVLLSIHSQIRTMPAAQKNRLGAFIAGENTLVLRVRDYLANTHKLTKQSMYAIPYWKQGHNEESYHQTRHSIMDEIY